MKKDIDNVPKVRKAKREDKKVLNVAKKKKIMKLEKKKIEKCLESSPPRGTKTKKKKSKPVATKDNTQNLSDTEVKPEEITISESSSFKTEKKMDIESSGHLKLSKQHVLSTIKAIKKLCQKKLKTKKSLLPVDDLPVYLQVTCVKMPKTPRRQIRPYLPHSLVGPLDDVAIFVPDLERGRRKDYEKTVDHWETIFREKGVDFIKQIIPMNQVKTEYNQFEMRRKLASSFDHFLVDGRIAGHMSHLLGKKFFKRKSAPTPVKLDRDNLKNELQHALKKTCMEIHSYGDNHSVRIGAVSTKSSKLLDNIWATCETLAKEYPGGWPNVRSIQIKTQNGPAVPIYLTLASKNDVSVPIVKPKRPRAYETIEGELSTLTGQTTVTVTPEGAIKLRRTRQNGKDVDVDIKEIEVDEEEEEEKEEEEAKEEEEEEGDDDDNDLEKMSTGL